MAANINDYFSEVSTGTRPTTTTVASVRSASGSSLVCDDLTGWTTDTAVHFVTYEIDGQGNLVPGTQQDMKGIVSGNTISNIVVTGGTDIGNKVGDVVQQLPTAAWAKDLADGLQVSHNQDGTLKEAAIVAGLGAGSLPGSKIEDGTVTSDKTDSASFDTCIVTRSGAQSIANNSAVAITFTAETVDTNNMWSSGTDVTIQKTGIYVISGWVEYGAVASGGVGYRQVSIGVNGDELSQMRVPHPDVGVAMPIQTSCIINLTAGDVVTLLARQTHSAAINVNNAALQVRLLS